MEPLHSMASLGWIGAVELDRALPRGYAQRYTASQSRSERPFLLFRNAASPIVPRSENRGGKSASPRP